MIALLLACGVATLWLALALIAIGFVASIERRLRLAYGASATDSSAPRSEWGSGTLEPPSSYALVRGLAGLSRRVVSDSAAQDASPALRRGARVASLVVMATALALVPFAGGSFVALDLDAGLLCWVVLLTLGSIAPLFVGLAERSVWARLGCVRLANQALVVSMLLVVVWAPLVVSTQSLRVLDFATPQGASFAPFEFVAVIFGATSVTPFLDAMRLPDWFVFTQPLTALLSIAVLALLARRAGAFDGVVAGMRPGGIGLDADWSSSQSARFDTRLMTVLTAAIFVTLFLGAADLPYFDVREIGTFVASFVGEGVASAVVALTRVGVFVLKLIGVLAIGAIGREGMAPPREDQILRVLNRRIWPLAWANLLLVVGLRFLLNSPEAGL